MSVYPFELDSDSTIIRIDDNITELGGEAINQLRDAVFAIEAELGLGLSGSMGTLANRLDVSLNANGTIKFSALASAGLVTLPIVDNHVASNAGIKEYKLALDHTTSDLYTLINANKALLDSVNAFATTTSTDFLDHLAGTTFISDGSTSARHTASQIDLNAVPSDPRDPFYTWTGLLDKTGTLRTARQAAQALLEINDDLVAHENATANAHVASAIDVDVTQFVEIPSSADTVQKVIDYLDNAEELNVGEHRAVQHSAGIPPIARSQSMTNPDGYGIDTVVSPTLVNAYLVHPPSNMPVDSNTVGDDIIKFLPTNTDSTFDAQFSQVRVGDILRINYGNGTEAAFAVESIRYIPGTTWVVRINGSNLAEAADGYVDGYAGTALARIDRPQYDNNTAGVLALAPANSYPGSLYPNILGSVIVGHPQAAVAVGLGFDGNQLNTDHYKLWLELYPTGNPADKIISLPFIDVTGDAGGSPGSYTLENVILATNNSFRQVGYNYRFIAFDHGGDFAVMLADPISKASFAIMSGTNASGTLAEGTFTNNVIGVSDGFDALGLGSAHANVASPAYQSTWLDETAAQLPTFVINPAKRRNYIVNGRKRNDFAATFLANADGYWPATITAVVSTGSSVEVSYQIDLDLCAAKLKAGKTIVVQPEVAFTDSTYANVDYGRFIIKDTVFTEPCGSVGASTQITVINGIHATGSAISMSGSVGLQVRIFFGEDSVSFNDLNVIDSGPTGVNYHRFHEIYVTNEGKTFSHERARMKADQAESSPPTSLLRSDLWHIKSVSPKLRGYRDGSTTLNKYVRFYVTSFDSTSGEFDGYIGQRNPLTTNITNVGPLTTGRKGVTTRFYDETYIDYIDLEFKETAAGPTGTAILTDANARYVDIEIFPSLRLDDELLLIGSCEVNWDPPSGQSIIQCVRNLRQFGSVDELDFTQSARDFISAGDRALHENGIIRGFEYVSTGTSTGELFYTGGMALVNGTIVTTNNSSVTIPKIAKSGTPADVTWAVCVNESGYLEPIVITTSKDQFFSKEPSSADPTYYVPSVTFGELVSSRKDLTIVSIVVATVGSIIINDDDVSDARKFVESRDASLALTWVPSDRPGNFHNVTALKQWLNNLGATKSVVKVNGTFDITSSIDLTGFDSKVVFDGEGAVFNVTSGKGLVLDGNVSIRNFTFNYDPTGVTYISDDLVNTGNGCIYALASTANIPNLDVEDCVFNTSIDASSDQRPPFINLECDQDFGFRNVSIRRNTFNNLAGIDKYAAIALINTNDGSGTDPAALQDVFVENNVCTPDPTFTDPLGSFSMGIYLTSVSNSNVQERDGLAVFNGVVRNNECGVIGILVSGVDHGDLPSGRNLLVYGNKCQYIASLDALGVHALLLDDVDFGTGSVVIDSNTCHWIHVLHQDTTSSNDYSHLKIVHNTLTANNATSLAEYTGDGSLYSSAIWVMTKTQGSQDIQACIISHNTIEKGRYSVEYRYGAAGGGVIWCESSAIISHNIIHGNANGTAAIKIAPGGDASPTLRRHVIQGNMIYRRSQTLSEGYINVTPVAQTDTGIITDNIFDSATIDGSLTTHIQGAPSSWIVERNINQLVTIKIGSPAGIASLNDGSGNSFAGLGQDVFSGTATVKIGFNGFFANDDQQVVWVADATQRNFIWDVPLKEYLPYGVEVTSVSVQGTRSGAAFSSASTTHLSIPNSDYATEDTFAWNSAAPADEHLFTLTPTSNTVRIVPNSSTGYYPSVRLYVGTMADTGLGSIFFGVFTITYRW